MKRPLLIGALLFYCSVAYCQQDIFLFKKGNKTIALFTKDSYIAFQVESREWHTGYITRIQNDSFFIRPMIVRFSMMGTDTTHYGEQPFAFSDVFAMPKKGVQVDYIKDRFQITTSGGHVHWYWVKSGWIFRVGAVGYTILDVANGLIKNNFTFSGSKYGIAAAVFLFGELLHLTYTPVLKLGKKYHLLSIKVSNQHKIG
jgi:hypothetical protein